MAPRSINLADLEKSPFEKIERQILSFWYQGYNTAEIRMRIGTGKHTEAFVANRLPRLRLLYEAYLNGEPFPGEAFAHEQGVELPPVPSGAFEYP